MPRRTMIKFAVQEPMRRIATQVVHAHEAAVRRFNCLDAAAEPFGVVAQCLEPLTKVVADGKVSPLDHAMVFGRIILLTQDPKAFRRNLQSSCPPEFSQPGLPAQVDKATALYESMAMRRGGLFGVQASKRSQSLYADVQKVMIGLYRGWLEQDGLFAAGDGPEWISKMETGPGRRIQKDYLLKITGQPVEF